MSRSVNPTLHKRTLIASILLCIAFASGYAQGGPTSGSGTKPRTTGSENIDKPLGASGAGSGTATGGDNYSAQNGLKQAAERRQFYDWLLSSPEGRRLAEFRAELEALAYASIALAVPTQAYKLRIKEAAAKGVPPAIVMAALREDARLWDALGTALWEKGWPPAAKAADLYISSATAQRNGLPFTVVLELIEWAASARAQSERVGAVLKALALIVASLPLEAPDAGRLAIELAQSRLPVGQFDELSGLSSAAAARFVSPGDFAQALIESLRQTKPLEALARRLSL